MRKSTKKQTKPKKITTKFIPIPTLVMVLVLLVFALVVDKYLSLIRIEPAPEILSPSKVIPSLKTTPTIKPVKR